MVQFRTSFKFDGVVVLDLLPPQEDPQTAQWLFDTVLTPLASEHGLNVAINKVGARTDLYAGLASVLAAAEKAGQAPILHIEAHGTPEGIQLPNRDLVTWTEIRSLLTDINRGCRMNLLAVMAMCHGRHLVSQLVPTDPSPVWGLVGPTNQIFPCRLQEGLSAFYQELFGELDGRSAVEAMNARHKTGQWDLTIDIAELVFCRVFREYVRSCTPDELSARVSTQVENIARQSNYDIRVSMHARALLTERIADHAMAFETFRHGFLMLDLFPENAARFTLGYDDCIGTA
jgi:hypothetical protein